jgi:hypothetical protein
MAGSGAAALMMELSRKARGAAVTRVLQRRCTRVRRRVARECVGGCTCFASVWDAAALSSMRALAAPARARTGAARLRRARLRA